MKFLISIFLLAAVSGLAQPAPTAAPAKHPFTFEDMMSLKRVGEPVPSPDGKWIVFGAEEVNLEANTKTSHLWIVPATGGEARRLNQSPVRRRAAAVFAGWTPPHLHLESDRSGADLDKRFRFEHWRAGRPAAPAHEYFHRS